jgi:K+-sensing histidine kinase KdpD
MNPTNGRHRITRAFSEIAHTLESTDDSAERITRTLGLLQQLVPYRSCAFLNAVSRTTHELYTVPELAADDERRALTAKLASVLRTTVTGPDEAGRVSDRYPHMTLPVVGLDRVIGVVRVEPPDAVAYDADHVGLLSIVCAQLGAYLTGLELRDDQARRLRDLQAAHDFQRLLVGVVGHDLRNPLSVIMAGAAMLQHAGIAPETQQELSDRIQKNVRRASRIIDDLLDVTQIQLAGGLQLHRKRVDLRKLVEDIAEDTRLANPDTSILVEALAQQLLVECDPDRVSQVLTNLVGNAVRYAAKGTPVRLALRAEGASAILAVHNRGPRIAADLLPEIFDPFRRGARGEGDRKAHGLGLGLYIVAEIVRSHGGRIDARSNAEETVFTVALPRGPTFLTEPPPFEPPAFSSEIKAR